MIQCGKFTSVNKGETMIDNSTFKNKKLKGLGNSSEHDQNQSAIQRLLMHATYGKPCHV